MKIWKYSTLAGPDISWYFHMISLGSRPDISGSLRPQPNKASFAAAWASPGQPVAFVDPDGKIGRRLLAPIHRFKILEIPHVRYLMKFLFQIFSLNQVKSTQIPLLSYKFYNFYIFLYKFHEISMFDGCPAAVWNPLPSLRFRAAVCGIRKGTFRGLLEPRARIGRGPWKIGSPMISWESWCLKIG